MTGEREQKQGEIPKKSLGLHAPAFEEVFEDESVFSKIITYIAKRNSLREQIAQIKRQQRVRDDRERGNADAAVRSGAAYSSNRALDDLIATNLEVQLLEQEMNGLDRENGQALLGYGDKWMQGLLGGNRSAFQVKREEDVQNPNLSLTLGSKRLEMKTYTKVFFFYGSNPNVRWDVALRDEESVVSEFRYDIVYDSAKSGTAQKIKTPLVILETEIREQRMALTGLYSGIFLTITDVRQQEQGKI